MKIQNQIAIKNPCLKPILFSWFHSSSAWRVRIALAYKGIEYDTRAVHLLRKEQFDSEFLILNPMGQVPALVINGVTLLQSIAIIEYLDEIYPEKPLLPIDSLQKARVREICQLITSGIQPIQNLKVQEKHSKNENEKLKWAQFWIQNGFDALEKILPKYSERYCFGNDVSMADCCLVPQVANAYRFGVNMKLYPTILKIHENLCKIDAFKKADAFIQPDCPEELRKSLHFRSML